MKAWRQCLSPAQLEEKSRIIAAELCKNLPRDTSIHLHTYLPIAKNNELDTWHILHNLWNERPKIKTVVPITNTTQHSMQHYYLEQETPLRMNAYEIPEPVKAKEVAIDQLDIVLVPLLAVDRLGNRVGYGKGYYDRFLSQCRKDTQKIGIGLATQLVETITGCNEYDQKLDCFLSEKGIVRFGENSKLKATY